MEEKQKPTINDDVSKSIIQILVGAERQSPWRTKKLYWKKKQRKNVSR